MDSTEEGILMLRLTQNKLEKQKIEIENEIAKSIRNAIQAKHANQKERIIQYMKQKKRLTILLTKRESFLHNITEILDKIEEAKSHKEVRNSE